ncbi:Uncharacterized protein HZ326_23833 [Fusarium oxysporum f. sp. albedinis]|nr:Uncharacterized protein HZ326_23833 [Fusarium oxysporum f. sp. albedinis]
MQFRMRCSGCEYTLTSLSGLLGKADPVANWLLKFIRSKTVLLPALHVRAGATQGGVYMLRILLCIIHLAHKDVSSYLEPSYLMKEQRMIRKQSILAQLSCNRRHSGYAWQFTNPDITLWFGYFETAILF